MNEALAIRANIDLPTYLRVANHGQWKNAPHLSLLCSALHEIDAGQTKRLIVNMPPRHGKSEVISKGFPGWYLGRHPDHEIMLTSYGAELAEDFSRINREKLREFGPEIFGVTISRASAAVGRWGITGHKGGLVAAGVNGPLTGRGANVAIIDDPIKGALEANSQTYRQHLLEWYQTVLRTRLAPGGAIIVVQTRWAKQDLAGWLIEQAATGGEQWKILNMPAISGEEPDSMNRAPEQALWPDRYPLQYLKDIKQTLTPYQWSALYQQQPIDYEGALWKFDTIDAHRVPAGSTPAGFKRIVVGVDPAVTSGASSDETGIIVAASDNTGHFYILDDRSGKYTPNEMVRTYTAAYWEHQANDVIAENNQGGDLIEALTHNYDRRVRYKAVRATRGKRIRAEPIVSLYEQGLVHHAGRFDQLEEQLVTWNPMSTDSPDRLDALVWALTDLSTKTPAYQPPIVL